MSYKSEIDLERYRDVLLAILADVVQLPTLSPRQLNGILRTHLKGHSVYFGRDDLIRAYRAFAGSGGLPPLENAVLERLRLKPVRSSSGIAAVTVLTKPFRMQDIQKAVQAVLGRK